MMSAADADPAVYLFPTSFAQRRLWFLDRITQNSDLYSVNLALRSDRAIDIAGLRFALAAVVERHEILRTTFVTIDGEPFQQIASEWGTGIEAVSSAEELLARPFDLERGPLLLVGVTPNGSVLVRMHHIITDGWSAEVFLAEIRELYQAWEAGREPILPELPIQYADFAVWQRERLSGVPLQDLLAFWREELAAAPTLTLATDRPRPAAATFRGGSVRFEIAPKTATALRALAHQERATTFMVTLTAFATVLARYSGQTDVLVGTPVAGRDRHELENLIGFFVNTVVIRCELDGDPSFRELLGRVRTRAVAAFAHQDLPFERLVEEIATVRDATRNPLVQVLFQLVNRAGVAIGDQGMDTVVSAEDGASRAEPGAPIADDGSPTTGAGTDFGWSAAGDDRKTSKFDLSLTMWETDGGLAGRLEFALDLFDPATAQRICALLSVALRQFADHPDTPISLLPQTDMPGLAAASDRPSKQRHSTRRDSRRSHGPRPDSGPGPTGTRRSGRRRPQLPGTAQIRERARP